MNANHANNNNVNIGQQPPQFPCVQARHPHTAFHSQQRFQSNVFMGRSNAFPNQQHNQVNNNRLFAAGGNSNLPAQTLVHQNGSGQRTWVRVPGNYVVFQRQRGSLESMQIGRGTNMPPVRQDFPSSVIGAQSSSEISVSPELHSILRFRNTTRPATVHHRQSVPSATRAPVYTNNSAPYDNPMLNQNTQRSEMQTQLSTHQFIPRANAVQPPVGHCDMSPLNRGTYGIQTSCTSSNCSTCPSNTFVSSPSVSQTPQNARLPTLTVTGRTPTISLNCTPQSNTSPSISRTRNDTQNKSARGGTLLVSCGNGQVYNVNIPQPLYQQLLQVIKNSIQSQISSSSPGVNVRAPHPGEVTGIATSETSAAAANYVPRRAATSESYMNSCVTSTQSNMFTRNVSSTIDATVSHSIPLDQISVPQNSSRGFVQAENIPQCSQQVWERIPTTSVSLGINTTVSPSISSDPRSVLQTSNPGIAQEEISIGQRNDLTSTDVTSGTSTFSSFKVPAPSKTTSSELASSNNENYVLPKRVYEFICSPQVVNNHEIRDDKEDGRPKFWVGDPELYRNEMENISNSVLKSTEQSPSTTSSPSNEYIGSSSVRNDSAGICGDKNDTVPSNILQIKHKGGAEIHLSGEVVVIDDDPDTPDHEILSCEKSNVTSPKILQDANIDQNEVNLRDEQLTQERSSTLSNANLDKGVTPQNVTVDSKMSEVTCRRRTKLTERRHLHPEKDGLIPATLTESSIIQMQDGPRPLLSSNRINESDPHQSVPLPEKSKQSFCTGNSKNSKQDEVPTPASQQQKTSILKKSTFVYSTRSDPIKDGLTVSQNHNQISQAFVRDTNQTTLTSNCPRKSNLLEATGSNAVISQCLQYPALEKFLMRSDREIWDSSVTSSHNLESQSESLSSSHGGTSCKLYDTTATPGQKSDSKCPLVSYERDCNDTARTIANSDTVSTTQDQNSNNSSIISHNDMPPVGINSKTGYSCTDTDTVKRNEDRPKLANGSEAVTNLKIDATSERANEKATTNGIVLNASANESNDLIAGSSIQPQNLIESELVGNVAKTFENITAPPECINHSSFIKHDPKVNERRQETLVTKPSSIEDLEASQTGSKSHGIPEIMLDGPSESVISDIPDGALSARVEPVEGDFLKDNTATHDLGTETYESANDPKNPGLSVWLSSRRKSPISSHEIPNPDTDLEDPIPNRLSTSDGRFQKTRKRYRLFPNVKSPSTEGDMNEAKSFSIDSLIKSGDVAIPATEISSDNDKETGSSKAFGSADKTDDSVSVNRSIVASDVTDTSSSQSSHTERSFSNINIGKLKIKPNLARLFARGSSKKTSQAKGYLFSKVSSATLNHDTANFVRNDESSSKSDHEISSDLGEESDSTPLSFHDMTNCPLNDESMSECRSAADTASKEVSRFLKNHDKANSANHCESVQPGTQPQTTMQREGKSKGRGTPQENLQDNLSELVTSNRKSGTDYSRLASNSETRHQLPQLSKSANQESQSKQNEACFDCLDTEEGCEKVTLHKTIERAHNIQLDVARNEETVQDSSAGQSLVLGKREESIESDSVAQQKCSSHTPDTITPLNMTTSDNNKEFLDKDPPEVISPLKNVATTEESFVNEMDNVSGTNSLLNIDSEDDLIIDTSDDEALSVDSPSVLDSPKETENLTPNASFRTFERSQSTCSEENWPFLTPPTPQSQSSPWKSPSVQKSAISSLALASPSTSEMEISAHLPKNDSNADKTQHSNSVQNHDLPGPLIADETLLSEGNEGDSPFLDIPPKESFNTSFEAEYSFGVDKELSINEDIEKTEDGGRNIFEAVASFGGFAIPQGKDLSDSSGEAVSSISDQKQPSHVERGTRIVSTATLGSSSTSSDCDTLPEFSIADQATDRDDTAHDGAVMPEIRNKLFPTVEEPGDVLINEPAARISKVSTPVSETPQLSPSSEPGQFDENTCIKSEPNSPKSALDVKSSNGNQTELPLNIEIKKEEDSKGSSKKSNFECMPDIVNENETSDLHSFQEGVSEFKSTSDKTSDAEGCDVLFSSSTPSESLSNECSSTHSQDETNVSSEVATTNNRMKSLFNQLYANVDKPAPRRRNEDNMTRTLPSESVNSKDLPEKTGESENNRIEISSCPEAGFKKSSTSAGKCEQYKKNSDKEKRTSSSNENRKFDSTKKCSDAATTSSTDSLTTTKLHIGKKPTDKKSVTDSKRLPLPKLQSACHVVTVPLERVMGDHVENNNNYRPTSANKAMPYTDIKSETRKNRPESSDILTSQPSCPTVAATSQNTVGSLTGAPTSNSVLSSNKTQSHIKDKCEKLRDIADSPLRLKSRKSRPVLPSSDEDDFIENKKSPFRSGSCKSEKNSKVVSHAAEKCSATPVSSKTENAILLISSSDDEDIGENSTRSVNYRKRTKKLLKRLAVAVNTSEREDIRGSSARSKKTHETSKTVSKRPGLGINSSEDEEIRGSGTSSKTTHKILKTVSKKPGLGINSSEDEEIRRSGTSSKTTHKNLKTVSKRPGLGINSSEDEEIRGSGTSSKTTHKILKTVSKKPGLGINSSLYEENEENRTCMKKTHKESGTSSHRPVLQDAESTLKSNRMILHSSKSTPADQSSKSIQTSSKKYVETSDDDDFFKSEKTKSHPYQTKPHKSTPVKKSISRSQEVQIPLSDINGHQTKNLKNKFTNKEDSSRHSSQNDNDKEITSSTSNQNSSQQQEHDDETKEPKKTRQNNPFILLDYSPDSDNESYDDVVILPKKRRPSKRRYSRPINPISDSDEDKSDDSVYSDERSSDDAEGVNNTGESSRRVRSGSKKPKARPFEESECDSEDDSGDDASPPRKRARKISRIESSDDEPSTSKVNNRHSRSPGIPGHFSKLAKTPINMISKYLERKYYGTPRSSDDEEVPAKRQLFSNNVTMNRKSQAHSSRSNKLSTNSGRSSSNKKSKANINKAKETPSTDYGSKRPVLEGFIITASGRHRWHTRDKCTLKPCVVVLEQIL